MSSGWISTSGRSGGHIPLHFIPEFKVGAVIASEMQSGRIALFPITELNWQSNPTDVFFGKVEFIQYKES